MVMKRFRARARGRGAKILKPFSNLTIKLKEREKEIIKNNNKKNKIKKNTKEDLQKGELKNGTKS